MLDASEAAAGESPRSIFPARLTALFAAAGNPTLERVVAAAERRMRAARAPGQRGALTVQRLSDWRGGRNLPSRFETFLPVLRSLIELSRTADTPADTELVDVRAWRELWKAAQRQGRSREPVVNALRRDIGTFIGRDTELRRILDAAAPGGVVSIHTIDGMPGIGKTALVTRAAHLLSEHYPDGQYFVELDAHTPGRPVGDPLDLLGTLLVDVGVDPRVIPETLAARRDLWRDRLAGKRVLLVLDDARDHEQIEALLPAAAGCLTLVTSRRRLIALDGAAPVTLDPLAPSAARELFCTLAQRNSLGDSGAAADIVGLCGHLPLAIVLLAGRLAHHPNWTVRELAVEFASARDRLDELDGGHRAVRAAFTTSYRLLPPARQRLFRRLGIHLGSDFDAYAVAALDDTTLAEARRTLEALYVEHLIDETAFGRYRMHDLVREYAQSLMRDEPGDPAESLDRVVDYFRCTALAAARPDHPARALGSTPRPALSGYGASTAWLRIERANLLACLTHTATAGQLTRVIDLARALVGEVHLHGAWSVEVAIRQRGAVAADSIGARSAENFAFKDLGLAGFVADDFPTVAEQLRRALHDHTGHDAALTAAGLRTLSQVQLLTGDFHEAAAGLSQVREVYREVGDQPREAKTLGDLGWVRHLTGDYPAALDDLAEALVLHRALGSRSGEAGVLTSIGWVRSLLGEHGSAIDVTREAAELFHTAGRSPEEAYAVSLVAWYHHLDGDYEGCSSGIKESLAIYEAVDNPSRVAFLLSNLAYVQCVIGDYQGARHSAQRALTFYREIGNRSGEASTLSTLGRIHCGAAEYERASDLTQESFDIYEAVGSPAGSADALGNLGWIRYLSGDVPHAEELLHRALATFRAIGHRTGETETLNRIGALYAASRDYSRALEIHEEALRLARLIHNHLEEGRALDGAARCRFHLGEQEASMTALHAAVTIYQRLGAAELASAEAYLAAAAVSPQG
ncbi:tetratricopeptide repeat protein [Nocardia crassostreae]|uniref:tetratricopeptide repeat protein n=1 Tax=Nocardia crassostreae TaxID=53428 RepID=UPI0014725F22|nr:tetratricopeptide repeat protein [Nocardia crassostreae]